MLGVEPLITEDQIQKRIQELALTLNHKLSGVKKPLFVAVLKGAYPFFSDLIRSVNMDIECDFLALSSYKGKTVSSGEVRFLLDLTSPVKGRDIVLVEDIVDTGLTMNFLVAALRSKQPKSITTVSLLYKPKALKVPCEVDCIGFEIGNDFVVGYGLDYQENYRELPYIGVVRSMC